MLKALGARALAWGLPWTNVYGAARSLLALGTCLTLLFNEPTTLFRPAAGVLMAPHCDGAATLSVFCWSPSLAVGRWASIGILILVMSGWRPMVTGLPHWWVSFGFQSSAITLDGGDHVTAVLTLLLLPVCLTDRRVWHWTRSSEDEIRIARRLVAWSALWVVRLQVAGIYFHAAIGKLAVAEWADGTALYYWLTDPAFGAPAWLRPLLNPVLVNPWGVTLLTWGSIGLEVFLFMALVMPRDRWCIPLALGLAFHFTIAIVQGLGSFGIAMSAALILYLRPADRDFTCRLGLQPQLGGHREAAQAT